jgi:hypothetical protein
MLRLLRAQIPGSANLTAVETSPTPSNVQLLQSIQAVFSWPDLAAPETLGATVIGTVVFCFYLVKIIQILTN